MGIAPTTRFNNITLPERIRLGILGVATAVTIILLISYLLWALQWRTEPFAGVLVSHTLTVNNAAPAGTNSWAGTRAGLLPGDRITAINGENLRNEADYRRILHGLDINSEVTLTFIPFNTSVERDEDITCDAASGLCQVTFALGTFSTGDFLGIFVIPFGSGIAVLILALLLLRLRLWEAQSFPAILVMLMLSIYMAGIFDMGSTHRLVPLWLANSLFLGGLIMCIGLIFPAKVPIVAQYPFLRFSPLLFSAILTGYVLSNYQAEPAGATSESAQTAAIFVIIGMALLATLLFVYQRPRATNATTRDQANMLFMGIMLSMVPALVWLGSQIIQIFTSNPPLTFSVEAAMPFYVIPAVAMAYALLQYRRFDSDQLVSQGITHTILFFGLAGGYFLMVLGASLITTTQANDPILVAVIVFGISVFFVPVRTFLQSRIDKAYFKTRHNYQNYLERFTQELTTLTDLNKIIGQFREILDETIKPSNMLIFLYNEQTENYLAYGDPQPDTDVVFTRSSGVISLLTNTRSTIYLQPGRPWPIELQADRARLGIIQVMILAGMQNVGQIQGSRSFAVSSTRLNGFVAIAPPRSGINSYNYEELTFVNKLVNQLSIAVEQAQVVNSLEHRVLELNVLSQVSQAVNFTIEFDDLLELISAQTLRVIPAPYFYIALHETTTDKLYFAFFLEDDERDIYKEDKKWSIGRDFFSEVLRNSQPRVLEDYVKAMAQNNYQIVFEKPDIKAWMGVPLIAGASTLGVLAVGTSDPRVKYTPEQVRIFSNIGALAATSIEKARLFTETNIRARQLEALNDINRQLVETEGDIEKLLNLITSSAVEILNAEAGSLLLTVEDGSGDLEFKAAVGGTGYELIGTRLPAGHGVVGAVGKTGQPILTNDTASDERWQGEVDQEFHTSSVLAVPLIAKNNVVGVLEVINKRDGSVFIQDDVDLLTTFAGQAAIAYENARLLQQTDLALTQRVQELEALELIDKELNKNLQLHDVARITIRWAVANSGATAGLLGIVDDEKKYLQIIHKYGYGADETPEGAQDNLWPLDKGIVRRVMRTRRADLQNNLEFDQDYIPSLKYATSQITVPMLSGDEVNAILVLESTREPKLSLLDMDWVQRLTEHASIAIANAQLYAELTRANETKSEFMGFAAHELKTPLTSIKGYAELIKSGILGEINTQQRDLLNIIRTNSDRMQTIIDDLRDIAKIDADQLKIVPTAIEVRNIVMDTVQTYQKSIEDKNQELVNKVSDNLPPIIGDRVRLVQVMTNLVSNANKYSPPGSIITIGAMVEHYHRNAKGEAMGPAMRIFISDNGIGMSQEDLQKLFRVRYFRSDNQEARDQPGTGLGMMITQNIINQHGGTIWVESKLGEGSTFHFTIPLAPETSEIRRETETETEPATD